jgi:thiol-disulfide isomerase/thioredoxin
MIPQHFTTQSAGRWEGVALVRVALVGGALLGVARGGAFAQQPGKAPQPPASTAPASSSQPAGKRLEVVPADLKWLDRLPKEDRGALDELLGWAPPSLASHLEWIGPSTAPTWADLRGKVIVLQSYMRIIALHTPDGAAEAREFLTKKPAPEGVMVAIDSTGAYCDELAIYKQPVNIVVDRNGAVRYAGLNNAGLEAAVTALVAEPFDRNLVVPLRSDGETAEASSAGAEFPPITGKVENALDVRGKTAPEFFVSQWITQRPQAEGKVVVLDFWATWCGPCVASIPHMNDLATRFKDSVVCVGISSEKPNDFEKGMAKLEQQKKITLNTFQYALALDPTSKMAGAMKIIGIPHCLVLDRTWTVRWQGHPATLDAGTLEKIVKADAAQGGTGSGGKTATPGAARRKRWVNE